MKHNSTIDCDAQPYFKRVEGGGRMGIVVYTDDFALGHDYVLQALSNLGLAHDLYYGDYMGFQAAVASGAYSLIIANHEYWPNFSYCWDNIYNELLAGKKAILSSFDWDGSHDYSGGYAQAVLALAGHTWAQNVYTALPLYRWSHIPNPWCEGMPNPSIPVNPNAYGDEGDALYGVSGESFAGWYNSFNYGGIAMNIRGCGLIVAGWCPDEYAAASAVTWWQNCIQWMISGPSATEPASWSNVKAMYR